MFDREAKGIYAHTQAPIFGFELQGSYGILSILGYFSAERTQINVVGFAIRLILMLLRYAMRVHIAQIGCAGLRFPQRAAHKNTPRKA